MVENIDNDGFFMSYQNCYILSNIQTIMSTRFKTEKSFKRSVHHHFIIGVSALTGSPYMMSRDQLWHVMTSSAGHGDALILSGTDASIRGIIIRSLRINPFSGIGLVSELFDPPTYMKSQLKCLNLTLRQYVPTLCGASIALC